MELEITPEAFYIGDVNDLLHGDFTISFLREQSAKCIKNCFPRFMLSAVHFFPIHSTNHLFLFGNVQPNQSVRCLQTKLCL